MIDSLKIVIVQPDLYWENKVANFANIEEIISFSNKEVDLIVLPEMFSTGFSMNAESLAEPVGLHTTKWMKQIAQSKQAVVVGSFIAKHKNQFYNRFLAIGTNGAVIATYDKQYLFPLSFEHEVFEPGHTNVVFDVKGYKIKPQICYDLRFPESARFDIGNPYDVLLYLANWPDKRIEHWNVLLKARAIENQSFVIGCNRVGEDGNLLSYNGCSQVINALGEVIISSTKEGVVFAVL